MVGRFVGRLISREFHGARALHHEVLPAVAPRFGKPAHPLPEALARAVAASGVSRLFRHQAEALDRIREGADVAVATPTASGKSLIYNLAVTEALLSDASARALYLFPMKALGRDQMETLEAFLAAVESGAPLSAAVYDGDTTDHHRAKIRAAFPRVILSNPDMLHYALLPFHGRWEEFFRSLRFVVVDEMHTYRGIFGSHVAQVFRRLSRISRHYGSDPRFILLSATIGNPAELAQNLIARPVALVTETGAPRAKGHYVFFEAGDGSLTGLAARLICEAAHDGLKTICFTQSRKLTELVHMAVVRMAPELRNRVSSYRAGFLPEERREIERRLSGGALSAVISTSALEAGIDIGGLDCCILVGYPGTVMTTRQRGGRVGRAGREHAVILLPQPDALDHYVVTHPKEVLSGACEPAILDPKNAEILAAHLPCAASELALSRAELKAASEPFRAAVARLTESGELIETLDGEAFVARRLRPHRDVDLRGIGHSYAILAKDENGEKERPIGRNDGVRALKECHPGAVYLHHGKSYVVDELDLSRRVIRASRRDAPYFTRVRSEKETEILEVLATKPAGNFLARLGRLRVTEIITGYEQRKIGDQSLLAVNPLDLPPQTFETVGLWFEIEPAVAEHVKRLGLHFMGGIHAVEHAAIAMFPLFALADRNDIGGISIPLHPQVGKGAVFIYDGYPGGVGLARRGYEVIEALLAKTLEVIASCPCETGCPRCIHSPKCGSGNKPLDKAASAEVLRLLLGKTPLAAGAVAEDPDLAPDLPPPEEAAPPKAGPRIGFFDLETQRLAAEVGGWGNTHLMRVSVAVLYDTKTENFEVFREEDVPRLLARLKEMDLVVGYNIRRFDYGVLRAYTPEPLAALPTFDMLEDISRRMGFRLRLDDLGMATLGRPKSADGLQAVAWFREGAFEPLTAYCKDDVALTRDLFLRAVATGYLVYRDKSGRELKLPTPWDIEKIVEDAKKGAGKGK